MQEGSLTEGVPEWRFVVLVNGVQRKAESVDWDGELSSDLPDPVAGVSGVAARTGTIRWAPQQLVQDRPESPWQRRGGWPPAPGAEVRIWAGDQATSWLVFVGRIDTTTGTEDSLQSKIVDDHDRLSTLVSIPAAAELMPALYDPSTPGTTWEHVGTALEPWHVAYRAMRAAGYGVAVPRIQAGTRLLEAELQGSLIATIGRLQVASQDKAIAWGPGYTYLAAGTIRYHPATRVSPGGLRLWLRWHGTASAVSAQFDDGTAIAIRCRRVSSTLEMTYTVRTGGYSGPIAYETTHTFTVATGSPSWVEVYVRPNDTTARVVVPTANAGGSTPNSDIEQTLTVTQTYTAGAVLEDIRLTSGVIAAQAGSISLNDWRAASSTVSESSVFAWGKGLVETMPAFGNILDRQAANILKEVSQATLTAVWFDEHGVLNWAPTNVLHAQQPVRILTTAQDIFSLGWTESLLARRKQIRVDYREAAISLSRRYETLLYQPSNSRQIGAGETTEDFIGPNGDQVWFEPDMSLDNVSLTGIVNFNLGRDSWYGGVFRSANDDTYIRDESMYTGIQEIEPDNRWLLRHVNPSTRDVSMMAPPESTAVYAKWWSAPLPMIRGRGLVEFTDAHVVANTGAPSWTPSLTHPMDVYGKRADAIRVRDFLAAALSTGIVTLTDIEVAYDPRLQLGDVVTVQSLQFFGFELDALIIGKSESQDATGAHMSLNLRVLRSRTTHTTYQDFEEAYQGRTYSALESAWATATYADLEAAPTERA